jgi:hypothetical protein
LTDPGEYESLAGSEAVQAAGVPFFAVSRFIGSSIATINQHYEPLAHVSRGHACGEPRSVHAPGKSAICR